MYQALLPVLRIQQEAKWNLLCTHTVNPDCEWYAEVTQDLESEGLDFMLQCNTKQAT
jgi:hypothetical protein